MPQSRSQVKTNLIKLLSTHAYGKVANAKYNYNKYSATTPACQIFSELAFVESNGILKANVRQSFHYHLHWHTSYEDDVPQSAAHEPPVSKFIEVKLKHLAQTLGIQFDPQTDFHGVLVISDPASIAVLNDCYSKEEKSELDLPFSHSSVALLFPKVAKPLESKAAPSEGLQELAALQNEIIQITQQRELLRLSIVEKTAAIQAKKKLLNPLGSIRFGIDEKLVLLPDVIPVEAENLVKSVDRLIKCIFHKYQLAAYGVWDINPENTCDLEFNCISDIPDEVEEIAQYLLALDIPMENDHMRLVFKLNQVQCDAAIAGMRVGAEVQQQQTANVQTRSM